MSPNEETMKVAVRCKHCGRLICYKMGTATGYVEMKCSKCGQKVLVNLSLRKRRGRVNYRHAANVSLYLPPITIQYTNC